MSTTIIRNGRVIDPANKRDEIADVVLINGRISDQSAIRSPKSEIEEIDAKGLIVAPGFIDMLGQSETNLLIDKQAVSKLMGQVAAAYPGDRAKQNLVFPTVEDESSAETADDAAEGPQVSADPAPAPPA